VNVKVWKRREKKKKKVRMQRYSLRVKHLFHSSALKEINFKINSVLRSG